MITDKADASTTARICLVIPCFNEARRLEAERFREFFRTTERTRIVFVNDGSRDQTLQVLQQLCRGYEDRASILSNDRNRGKAEAVRSGIVHALGTFSPEAVGYWDADLATPLEALRSLLAVLDERPNLEMVFGSRVKLLGRHVERRAVRHYLGRVFATVISVMLQLPIYDSQCGAKLFRANEDCRRVFADPFLTRWVFDVEILARYLNLYGRDPKRLEQAIYEYPLEKWVDVAGSKLGPADFVKAIGDILRIRRHYLR